ncbi:MAG: 2OG-Fe(II) oxygenase [Isosphaeraceae bacterium]
MRAACASGGTVFQRASGIGGVWLIHSYYDVAVQKVQGVSAYNKNWSPDNYGALELWDQRSDRVEREVLPEFGTAVIFQTDEDSMHGFSKPIVDRFRNSVAMYYYTAYPTNRYSGDWDTHWRTGNRAGKGVIRLPVRKLAMFCSRASSGAGWRLANLANRLEDWAGGRES